MNTLTKKDKLALQVSLTLVAGMFSLVPVAQGAPVLDNIVTGGTNGTKVYTHDNNDSTPDGYTVIMSATTSANNVVNWKDFSIAEGEHVVFDAANPTGASPAQNNNYLNIVTGNGTSYINGNMEGGKNVYLVNPQGVIMGEKAVVDVGNLYVSTRDLSDDLEKISKGAKTWDGTSTPVLSPSDVQSEVVNMGNIQANSVYVEGTNIRFLDTADVQDSNGNLLSDVTLVTKNNAGYVHVGYKLADNTPNAETGVLDLSGSGRPATTLGYTINGETYNTPINAYTGKNPYDFAQVENAYQLQGINNNKSINYMLTKDILNVGSFEPIGTYDDQAEDPYKDAFTGNFDGNYHTISGLDMTTGYDYAGLFGYVRGAYEKVGDEEVRGEPNSIRNVGIVNPKIIANKYGGALAGVTDNTIVENVYAKNTEEEKYNTYYVTSSRDYTASYNVTNINDGEDSGSIYPIVAEAIGGLIGKATGNSIINSVYNDNTVSAGAGIVGELDGNSTLTNAYNNGLISNEADYRWDKDNYTTDNDGYIKAEYREHYGIVDKITSGSVANVYNSGAYFRSMAREGSDEAVSTREITAPEYSVTNGYVINKYDANFDAVNLTITLSPVDTPTIVSTGDSATSASSYAFFPIGKSISNDEAKTWRIYDGHSLPLLRSFLKANGNGTVPVGYKLALYANATATTENGVTTYERVGNPTMKMKGDSADGTIVYNGYYIGGSDVEMDESRGLDSSKVGSSTTSLIKNVNDKNIFFYSFDQDGYDLATESLTVTARPLANPEGIKDVDKVYDGTPTASTVLANQFGKKMNLLNYKIDPDDNSAAPLVEDPGYGIVEVFNADGSSNHTDDVVLSDDFITSATYESKDANIQSVDNTNHPNGYKITVTADHDATQTLKYSKETTDVDYDSERANDYKNYSLTADVVENINITGDITLRPVRIGLHNDGSENAIEKVYDKSSQVVYVGDGWTANEGDTITAKDNVYQATATDTGLMGTDIDDAVLSVATPYYTNSSGNPVSDARNASDDIYYSANYKFILEGTDVSNYQVQDLNGNKLDMVTNGGDSYYLLTGAGNITKRSITADSISFAKNDGTLVERTIDPDNPSTDDVHGTKVYDNSTNFFYYADKPSTSEYAAKVLFDTTNTITPEAALAHDPNKEDGFIWDPNDPNDAESLNELKNALTLTNAEFSGVNVDGVTIEGNEVDNKITYYVEADPSSDIWNNYTLDGHDVSSAAVPIEREGTITHRIITVGMRDGIGSIDKVYDQTADVVDTNNANGYKGFYGTNATNSHDNGYVTYADGSTKLVKDSNLLDDGVAWSISGEYQAVPAAETHNGKAVDAADVYLDADGNPAAKKIVYSVGLSGTSAVNYIIKNADETDAQALARVEAGTDTTSLNASGVIDQLELTPGFAAITKQYDGTTYVLPQTVTMSDGSEGTLTPKTADGTTAQSQISITLPGLLDAGTVAVDTTAADFSAVYASANASNSNIPVYYSGLKLVANDGSSKVNNYKISSTGTGNGTITKLKLDSTNLTPEYNNVSKIYDNDTALANASSFVSDIAISGVAGTGAKLTILDGTTAEYANKNRGGQDDGHAVTFTFNVKDESGNYYFGNDTSVSEYSFTKDTTGKILARDVTPVISDNLTKVYDAMAEYTDGSRNELTGDAVLTLDGIISGDAVNTSTAVYNDASAGENKSVTYTASLTTYDPTNYNITSTTLTGSGTINKRPLTLTFADLSKKYDGTADLTAENVAAIAVTLDDGLNGAVIGADGTSVNKANLDTDYSYGVLDNTGFSSNANAGAANAVRYNGIDADVLGDKIGNYSLYYKYGDSDAAAIVNGTGYGLGSIGKKKLAYTDFAVSFNDVTKVYDATDAVKADGGVNTLVESFAINGQTVDYATSGNSGYSIASANYGTMDNNGAFTSNVNAGSQSAGTQNAVFKFTIGSDWEDNYDFSDLANNPYFDSTTRTVAINTTAGNGNATITAKTIYAALSEQYSTPTKVYDGTKKVKNGNTVLEKGALNSSGKYGNYVTVSGLEGNDASKVQVEALYNSANVADKDDSLGNTVNYTIDMGTVAGNYNLQGVDAGNKLQGAGVITPKEVYLDATEAKKYYDGKADVKMAAGDGVTAVPAITIKGTVTGDAGQESITYTASGDAAQDIYGTYLDANLDPDANVALNGNTVDYKAVRYSNVFFDDAHMTAAGNTQLSNYVLASGGNGTYDAENNTVTFDKTAEKGKIEKLAVTSIVASYDAPESKVYDGTTNLTYNHAAYDADNNPEGYFGGQVKEVTTISSVKGVRLNASSGYSVLLDSADDYSVTGGYTDAGVGTGNKTVNYNFTVDKSVFKNLIFGTYDGTADYTFTDSTSNNTIEAKKIYATLNDVNPVKTYDGSDTIINKAKDDGTTITQDRANSYVNVMGLMGNDAASYTVTPAYSDKNVARDGEHGNVVAKDVNYAVSGISSNYQLYVGDNVTNVLQGKGIIEPKEVTLNVGLAKKTYDGTDETAIDMSTLNPGLTINTGVAGETLVLGAGVTGQYGNYTAADGFAANGDVNYGETYADKAGYKAVQYTGLQAAWEGQSGTADEDNYKLVGTAAGDDLTNDSGYAYDVTNDTVTFSEKGEKGRITRRQLDNLKTKWESAEKEYDAYTDIEEDDRDNTFKIYTDVLGTDPEKWIYVNYDLSSANYTDDSGNGKSDVGDYNMRYVLNGITAKDLQNFSMGDLENTFKNKAFDSKNGNATYNLDGSVTDQGSPVLGSIIKRLISGQSVKQVRTYNGGTKADGSETYFQIDQDDLEVLGRNGKDRSALNVVAEYTDKDSTLDVNGNKIDDNTVNVTYTFNWAAGQADTAYQGNYEFAGPYVGEGDIVQRRVYVADNGGKVVEKTYDGGQALPSDANPAGRFALSALAGQESETGLVKGEDDIRLKTKNADDTDAITGNYLSPNVARDNGKVVNTAVQYEGFELEDSNTASGGNLRNYAIAVQPEDGKADLTDSLDGNTTIVRYGTDDEGKLVITEEKGGRINPKEITVNVVHSPEKEYDRGIAVKGTYKEGEEDKNYASIDNIQVKVGDEVKNGNISGNTLTFTEVNGDNTDTVEITFNNAEYENPNASSGDKVSKYDLSWVNDNYELVGETKDPTVVNGDTFVSGYNEDNPTLHGTLTDYTGTINPRLINVTKVDKVVKTYDGDAAVESNPTFDIIDADTSNPHFYIADDDKALLVDDKLDSYLAISGNYENKNANIYPKEYSEETAEGGKKVNYNLVWNGGDEDARKNYKFVNADEYDITGTGDILRRAVTLTDNGGDVLTRTYKGTENTDLPDDADLTKRFSEDRSVILDDDVKLDTAAVITGAYAPDGDVARDSSGKVINKAVEFSGFELKGTVDADTGFNSKDNYYLTAEDEGTATLNNSLDDAETKVTYSKDSNGKLLSITEEKGGRIEPKNITIGLVKSPTKVYDTDNLVKTDEDGTAYAAASNLEAAADKQPVGRSFGNANNVIFTIDPGSGTEESFDVTIEGNPVYVNTATGENEDNSMDVSRGTDGSVSKDKITAYNLSWTNGNYNLVAEDGETFDMDGTDGYTDGTDKRTGVLKDYAGEIRPYKLKIKSMDATKTYDGGTDVDPQKATIDYDLSEDDEKLINQDMINRKMAGSGNIQDFLGLTVGSGQYGAPTEAAKAEALATDAPANKAAAPEEIAEAEKKENYKDAAFNRTADPYQHQVTYSGIALAKGNYEVDATFDGTGTINRALVTAKPDTNFEPITAGDPMPTFTGELEGFMKGETIPQTYTTTVSNEDGTTTTTTGTRDVPLAEYYSDSSRFYWGPDPDNVTNYNDGTHAVYGWYKERGLAYDENGEVKLDEENNPIYKYYYYNHTNFDKNYTLTQLEMPVEFTIYPAPSNNGGKIPIPEPVTPEPVTPEPVTPEPVTPEPVTPEPVTPEVVVPEDPPQPIIADVGYVEKAVAADGSVYQNVSKDTSGDHSNTAEAAIQYGENGTSTLSDGSDDSSTGSISIEVAEVVNLLGDDVASDGTVSLTNTEKAQELSVESTEEGYLSVGTAGKKSRIGIETETASDEAKILPGYDSQVQFDNLHQGDEEDENKDDEEEEKEENERESEAAITYNDVA